MIRSFRHKGIAKFFGEGSKAGIQPDHANRLKFQLAVLETAKEASDLDRPGYGLHELKGDQAGRWAIKVNGNWRLTFEFTAGDVFALDYEDYH